MVTYVMITILHVYERTHDYHIIWIKVKARLVKSTDLANLLLDSKTPKVSSEK